ncbi:MurR/RpiR family transcriptional regulator [Oceanobacillus jeddahense]|uniref:MurR/RpiR family transcriptional regulator n=1 Tax=Oceanobacillus jeddahense TaxID=1462527 RepID=A0ABY5JV73_9BACI|nr:MurR/RpiR family transcriptional regulator [Oceanobacillus jeddahense]UUI02981.1 MurR/RpiR family transcriptional regulator [Oceanobacillus jeddahense]
MDKQSVLKKIINQKESLPKKQKKFCEFVLEHYRTIGLDSIGELSSKADVGTTTILRTINNLGYKTLNDFKKDLHKAVIDSKTPKWWDFNDSKKNKKSSSEIIKTTWDKINFLQSYTMNDDFVQSVLATVDLMINASRINIFGLRSARSVALYLENSINQFYPKCNQLSYEPHYIFDRMHHFNDDEIVVLVALSPYTQLTYDVAKYCAEKKMKIVLITDSEENSMIPYASVTVFLFRSEDHYTLVPAISLVETITVLLGITINEDSAAKLDEIGQLLAQQNITKT